MIRSLRLVAVLLAGLPLMACGAAASGSPGSTADSGETVPRSPVQELGSASPTSKAAPELTLTGTVSAGVEKGCLVLESDGKAYVLLGELAGVLPGSQVTVRGHEATNVQTTCQQGPPFQVTAVVAATVWDRPGHLIRRSGHCASASPTGPRRRIGGAPWGGEVTSGWPPGCDPPSWCRRSSRPRRDSACRLSGPTTPAWPMPGGRPSRPGSPG